MRCIVSSASAYPLKPNDLRGRTQLHTLPSLPSFVPCLCLGHHTDGGIIMDIVLIGGSIEALLLSIELVNEHNISIVELEAEIGLPAHHPGRIVDLKSLDGFFTDQQQSFLELKENQDGWGCRWEWVMKHTAAIAARRGVSFLTRTRIRSCTRHDASYVLELTSTERTTPTHIVADRVVLMSQPSTAPGGRDHTLLPSTPLAFPSPQLIEWFGGTVLTTDVRNDVGADLVLKRNDGTTELWWSTTPPWTPPRGFLEQCRVRLPEDTAKLSLDSVMSRSRDFAADFL